MKGRMRGKATRGEKLNFGDFGLKTLEAGWITDRQIEAARIAMTRHVKRGGKIWIRMFPDKPITKKPAETRMGSGKGAPDHWVAVVKPGRVLYEIEGVDENVGTRSYAVLRRRSFRSRPSSSAVPTSREALFRNETQRTDRPASRYERRGTERAGRRIEGIAVSG